MKLVPHVARVIVAVVHPMRYGVYVPIRPVELVKGVLPRQRMVGTEKEDT